MKTNFKILKYVFILLIFLGSSFKSEGGTFGQQEKGKPKKPGWIGLVIQDVNKKIAKKAKLDSRDGAYVKEVLEGSPADSAGIKEGDVIIEFNGNKIYDSDDLMKEVRRTQPGTKVNITYIREGIKETTSLIVGKQKRMKAKGFNLPPICNFRFLHTSNILGLKLITLNEQLAEYFNAPNKEGVLVEEVEEESIGEKAGFKAGDVIIRVGKKSIGNVEKFKKELRKYDEEETVEIEVIRKGAKKVLNVKIEEEDMINERFFFHTPRFRFFQGEILDDVDTQPFELELEGLKSEMQETEELELEQNGRKIEASLLGLPLFEI